MNIKFTGRAALIVAAGLWMGVAHVTPSRAQEAEPAAPAEATEAPAGKPIALTKFTKQHVAKKKVASSSRADKARAAKAKPTEASDDAKASEDAKPAATAEEASPATLPASVADANAQAPGAWPETPAPAVPAEGNPLQAEALIKSVGAESHQDASAPTPQVVAADELNEIDRNLGNDRPALTLASATLDAPAAATADDTTWDKTSLIGKVFIALGGLLTMASAARMFMA